MFISTHIRIILKSALERIDELNKYLKNKIKTHLSKLQDHTNLLQLKSYFPVILVEIMVNSPNLWRVKADYIFSNTLFGDKTERACTE